MDREQFMKDTLECLKGGWHIEQLGVVREAPVVADCWPHKAAYYSICDNGGEFHVHELNSSNPGESVPYDVSSGLPVDAGTMAYRIALTMRGEKIEWGVRFSQEEISIMKAA